MNFNLFFSSIQKIFNRKMAPVVLLSFLFLHSADAQDLEGIMKSGTLRHLGIPYANFVIKNYLGLDVELMQQFAEHLGVKYRFIESTWQDIIPDLTGKIVKPMGADIQIIGERPIKGDVIATGFTVLPWREKIVAFSDMTFPSGIWLISRGDSPLTPVVPTGNMAMDIAMVEKKLNGISVLGLKGSCLDPDLYGIKKNGARIQYFPSDQDLEEMIPSVMANMAETTLMDVPVALVALTKWPGKIKVIGPLSEHQDMACAFSKSSPKLKQAFDSFFSEFKKNGGYRKLVTLYYPSVFTYYPDFL